MGPAPAVSPDAPGDISLRRCADDRDRLRGAHWKVFHRLGPDASARTLSPVAILRARLLCRRNPARSGTGRHDRTVDVELPVSLRLGCGTTIDPEPRGSTGGSVQDFGWGSTDRVAGGSGGSRQ